MLPYESSPLHGITSKGKGYQRRQSNHVVSINAVVSALTSHTFYPITLRKYIILRKMSNKVAVSKSETQAIDITKYSQPSSLLFLDQLDVDVSGTIMVMIGRMWDVNAITGRYLSTDFVVSDSKHVIFMLEFDGATTIRKASVSDVGFLRNPFQLVDFDRIEPTNNKYLIGRKTYQKSGSRTLDFYLANQRFVLSSAMIIATFAINLYHMKQGPCTEGDAIERTGRCFNRDEDKTCWHVCRCLTSMSAKHYNNKLYLSSSSSTTIYDNENIPTLQELKTKGRYKLEIGVADDTSHVIVILFDEPTTKLVKCSAESLLASVDESADEDSKLRAAITNLIRTTHVLELKSHTYYEYGSFESFTCWKINLTPLVEEGVSSSMVEENVDTPLPAFKRFSRTLSVCTPSKGPKEKKKKRSILEDSYTDEECGSSKNTDECDADARMDKNKNKSLVHSPQNNPTIAQSFSSLLHNSVIIQSNTTIRHDGRVQSYCGLRLTDMDVLFSGVPVTYHNIGPPTHECPNFHATMWYAPCINDGKCSKHFPKSFLEETVLDEDGYPNYWRRDNKVTTVKGKFTDDNKYVVPHKCYLLLKYNAHINIEWCNRSKAIKYLFKYLNKGPDKATIVIEENVRSGTSLAPEQVLEVDKIKNYLNCWFLAPCEAVWHLFSFDIHYSHPTVMQLNFHLPNQNPITLHDSESLPALLEREGINIMMFTDWFELNKCDPAARTLTYADIPKHYVWHEQQKLWKPRKQRKCIGRIVYSSPASGE
ncbi:ATP-dependent DNA helicase PIF1 [Tanacetum coccineum]